MKRPTKERLSMVLENRIALLGAFSMFLSTIEYLFPRPLPFLRLGLANLPLLLGLEILSWPSFILLVCIKVLGQALVNGTLASYVFLFSLSGSLASALIMKLSHDLFKKRISYIGISLLGALASNMVQISLSITFIFGDAAWRILPVFLGIGLFSGFFIGLFAEHFAEKSRWWHLFVRGESGKLPAGTLLNGEAVADAPGSLAGRKTGEKKRKPRKKRFDRLGNVLTPGFRFWMGVFLIPAYLFIDTLTVKLFLVVLFAVTAVLSGKRIRFFYFFILITSITFFHLLTPTGRLIAEAGPFKITLGALEAGVMKGLTLCGLVFISLFSVSGKLRLPGRLGGMLARTFYYFEEILEGRGRLKTGKVIATLDGFLLERFPPQVLEESGPEDLESTSEEPRQKLIPALLYALILGGVVWGALVLEFLLS